MYSDDNMRWKRKKLLAAAYYRCHWLRARKLPENLFFPPETSVTEFRVLHFAPRPFLLPSVPRRPTSYLRLEIYHHSCLRSEPLPLHHLISRPRKPRSSFPPHPAVWVCDYCRCDFIPGFSLHRTLPLSNLTRLAVLPWPQVLILLIFLSLPLHPRSLLCINGSLLACRGYGRCWNLKAAIIFFLQFFFYFIYICIVTSL